MNVVKIMGGLGNQFCQYAIGKYLEQFDSVGYDISYYDSEINKNGSVAHRELLLPKFVDNLVFASQEDRERVNQWEFEKGKPYENKFFFGDWQKADFFKGIDLGIHVNEDIMSEEARAVLEDIRRHKDSVAIHVRRTDYETLGWELPLDYYREAIEKTYSFPGFMNYYIFTDDPEWCRENFWGRVEHFDELTDFYLMNQCKHQIIANSTFSFWAAYLNNNPDKKVIYPKEWRCTSNPCEGLPWIGV